MHNTVPLGEEIWIRRDTQNRGGSLFVRELFIFLFIYLVSPIALIISLFYIEKTMRTLSVHGGFRFLLLFIYGIFLSRVIYGAFRNTAIYSKFCPVWLYAEQLNPERLTIYHFRKSPTTFPLSNSKIDQIKVFNLYTTLIITNSNDQTATLGLLTPEEHDRFMHYWNAANPPPPSEE